MLKFPVELNLNGLTEPLITFMDLKIQDKDGIEIPFPREFRLKIKPHDVDDAYCECQLVKKTEWTSNKRKNPSGSSSSGFSGKISDNFTAGEKI